MTKVNTVKPIKPKTKSAHFDCKEERGGNEFIRNPGLSYSRAVRGQERHLHDGSRECLKAVLHGAVA